MARISHDLVVKGMDCHLVDLGLIITKTHMSYC